MNAVSEFERQLENLISKRYPDAAGLEPAAFRRQVEPLREVAAPCPTPILTSSRGASRS